MKYTATVLLLAGINMIAVSGCTVLTGYGGMFSLGQAGFMSIGAYFAACFHIYGHIPFLLAVLLGALVSTAAAVLIGFPVLKNKLTGDYFAVCMLGFGEAVRLISANFKPYIKGAMGLTGIPRKTTLTVVVVCTLVVLFLIRNYLKSHYGKNLIAIRQQEVAAEMMGMNIMSNKMWALAISGFTCGFAGALYAFYATTMYPTTYGSAKSTDLNAAVVFGGVNSLSGPMMAAIILAAMPEVLRAFAMWRLVIYGLLFVVIMLFRPEGLFGNNDIAGELKRLWRWIKRVWAWRTTGRKEAG